MYLVAMDLADIRDLWQRIQSLETSAAVLYVILFFCLLLSIDATLRVAKSFGNACRSRHPSIGTRC